MNLTFRFQVIIFFYLSSCGQHQDILEPEMASFTDNATADFSEEEADQTTATPFEPKKAPTIDELTVGGQNLDTILVKQDEPQIVQWKTSHSDSCSLKQGNDAISSEMSGSIVLSFNIDAPISLSCSTASGEIVNRVISVVAVSEVIIAKFKLGGQEADEVSVKKDKAQILEWEASGAENCSLMQEGTLISSETLGTREFKFKNSSQLIIKCVNALNSQVEKSINVMIIPDPKITLTVGGQNKKSIEVLSGSNQLVSWSSENAASCNVKHGNIEIGNTPGGTIERTFSAATKVSVDCVNSIGIKKSKSIEVNLILTGNINNAVSAFYFDRDWSGMLVSIDANNNFLATYNLKEGSIKGTYNPETGVIQGRWCEEDENGIRAADIDHVGDVEFMFIQDAKGKLEITGKWRNESDEKWNKGWDMKLEPEPDAQQESIQNLLYQRFNNASAFCQPISY